MTEEKTLYPLRERRKSRTRHALLVAARELIAEKGFDEFTLEQVADRAEVHVQTLYRHFPTKSDLFSAGASLVQEGLEVALKERAEDQTTIDVWRAFVAQAAAESDKLSRQFVLPAESSASWGIHVRYIELLTEGLAKDMGVSAKADRRPYLIACMLKGANDSVFKAWWTSGKKGKIKSKLLQVIDDVAANFIDERAQRKMAG